MSGLASDAKIAVMARTLSPNYGGAAGVGSFVRNLLLGWDEIGQSYTLVPRDWPSNDSNRFLGEIVDSLKMGRENIILCPNYFISPFHRPSSRKVVVIHDLLFADIPKSVRPIKRIWQDLCYRIAAHHADKIVFISKFSLDRFSAVYGEIYSEKFCVIPNPINTARFQFIPFNSEAGGRPTVSTLSAYYPHKNFELFLRIAQLRRARYDFMVIGRRPGQKALDAMAAKLGEDPLALVTWTDYVPDDAIPVLLARSSAFVFPSRYEGFGMPPLEAISVGVPVIASRIPALEEQLEGLADLIDVDGPIESWIAAVDAAICNRPEEKILRARSATVTERCSPKIVAAMYADVCLGP